jgi:hypothetical protein
MSGKKPELKNNEGLRTVDISFKQLEAIRMVIEYLQDWEEDDYEHRGPKDRKGHIWPEVKRLRDWYHAESCDR